MVWWPFNLLPFFRAHLSAPGGLSVRSVGAMQMSTLSWNEVTIHTDGSAVTTGEVVGYNVMDTFNGTSSVVASGVIGTSWILPSDLAVGTHEFSVVALDSNGNLDSAPSAILSHVVPPPPAALSAPTGLTIA